MYKRQEQVMTWHLSSSWLLVCFLQQLIFRLPTFHAKVGWRWESRLPLTKLKSKCFHKLPSVLVGFWQHVITIAIAIVATIASHPAYTKDPPTCFLMVDANERTTNTHLRLSNPFVATARRFELDRMSQLVCGQRGKFCSWWSTIWEHPALYAVRTTTHRRWRMDAAATDVRHNMRVTQCTVVCIKWVTDSGFHWDNNVVSLAAVWLWLRRFIVAVIPIIHDGVRWQKKRQQIQETKQDAVISFSATVDLHSDYSITMENIS